MFGANSSLQQPSTVGHLENQMASALVLKSSSEYHFWFTTYVRYIVQEGEFVRPVYTEHQSHRCNIEYNGVAPELDCKPFSSDSIVFNKIIASGIAELSQR